MGKIKIGDIEGEADDIKNLFLDLECDLSAYINAKPITDKIPKYWLYILTPIFFISACLLAVGLLDNNWSKVVTLLLFLILGFISLIIQHNYKDWRITTIAFLTGFCLILIGLNIYTPEQISKKIEEEAVKRIPTSE
ncbi:hypothetical protein [Flavobacterium sp.]|uniref:hypothetical protein n=1 Tax=Flavobacterium sp. TaxID=239 RepID=UPI004048A6A2